MKKFTFFSSPNFETRSTMTDFYTICFKCDDFRLNNFHIGLDVRIGSVLGRHSSTKELYAIHRNEKFYMIFRNTYKKWFSLTNQQFKEALNNLDPIWRKTLEGDYDQIYTLGNNQWLGKYVSIS